MLGSGITAQGDTGRHTGPCIWGKGAACPAEAGRGGSVCSLANRLVVLDIRLCRLFCSQPNDAIFSDSLGSSLRVVSTSKQCWWGLAEGGFLDISSCLNFPGSREGTKWQQTDSQMLAVQRVQFVQPALIEHLLCVGMHTPCLPWHQMQCKVINSHPVPGLATLATYTHLSPLQTSCPVPASGPFHLPCPLLDVLFPNLSPTSLSLSF